MTPFGSIATQTSRAPGGFDMTLIRIAKRIQGN
jgi:hypothetical protein